MTGGPQASESSLLNTDTRGGSDKMVSCQWKNRPEILCDYTD
jgi:hypothetical protein